MAAFDLRAREQTRAGDQAVFRARTTRADEDRLAGELELADCELDEAHLDECDSEVDAVLRADFVAGGDMVDSGYNLSIGNSRTISGWNGLVDQTDFFAATLRQSHVTYLYNSGAGRAFPQSVDVNEVQRITVAGSPAQGTLTLTYSGQTTANIVFNADATAVDTALEDLSNIGAGDVTCSGGPLPGSVVDVAFTGALSGTDVSQMTANSNKLTTSITTTTPGVPARSEVQRLTATPTPILGTFTLTFGANTTSALQYTSTAAQITTALEALASIGAGNVTCTGGPINSASVTVTFQGGLANTNVATITASSSMTGNPPTITVTTTTDGGPGPNEIQRIAASPTPITGTFTLTFGANTTASIAYNATAAAIQAALELLASIGSGNISCTGGPLSSGNPVDATFQGTLAQTDVALMTASSSMTGQAGAVTVAVTVNGAGPINERQQIFESGTISGGTYALTYSGQTTSALDFTSTASDVSTALIALSNIGPSDVTLDGGALNSLPINVEFTGSLAGTNVAEMSVSNSLITPGGFARGAQYLTYSNVQAVTDRRVVTRQILRNKFGDATVFYVDVETTDLTSTSFTSYKTDEELTTAVPLQDANGFDLNVIRHGEPPNQKRAIASFLNRIFLAVNHVSTSGEVTATNASLSMVGEDAFFRTVYDGRTLSPVAATNTRNYLIDSLNVSSQTLTNTETYTGSTANGISYGLQTAPPDDLTIYFSELDDAESWNVLNGLTIERVERDGLMTGLCPLVTSMLILFEHRTYKLTFRASPLLSSNPEFGGDGRVIPASSRGCVNHRCCVKAGGMAYLLDDQGIYTYDDSNVNDISDPIQPMFSLGHQWSIYWPARESFHAVYDADNNTIKWFVVIGDGMYPRHAICWHTDRQRFWIEEYPWPITASVLGNLGRRQVVFLGSTGRRLFVSSGSLDAIDVQTYANATLRGTVTSAKQFSLTDSTATFPSSLVNVPVRIVSGKGSGQQNIVVSNTATKLVLLRPWVIAPDTTSTYQLGGIGWTWKSSMMRLTQTGSEELRGVQATYTPNTRASTVVLRKYADFNDTADTFAVDYNSDGTRTTNGSNQIVLDLTHSTGFVEIASDSFFAGRGTHQRYVTVELTGTTNGEQQQIRELAVIGVEA